MPKPLISVGDIVARHLASIAMSREYALEARRPKGVDKARFGMAATINAGEPVLTANPKSIIAGILYKETGNKVKFAKGLLYKRIVVKPTCMETARLNHPGGFWGERTWIVHTLKYSRGFVATTDHGQETKSFGSYGELRAAIQKSGWEILRSV